MLKENMQIKENNKISFFPKVLFCFVVSFIFTAILFGVDFFETKYMLFFVAFRFLDIISSAAFELYMRAFAVLLFQSIIYSIVACAVDIWSFEESYESTKLKINNEKIKREIFFKMIMIKHIPIFSLLNGFVKIVFGKSFLDIKYKTNAKPIKQLMPIRIILVAFVIIFTLSGVMYFVDDEIYMIQTLENIETINSVDTTILKDTSSNQYIYNLNVYLEDGYIHYNKLTYAKEQIEMQLKDNIEYIKNKYRHRFDTFQGFNIVIYNNYTKTWDKYIYNSDMSEKYEMSDISTDIYDVDIYIKDGALVYNLLTNLSRDDIGWDIAEFLLHEFESDIENKNIQSKIQNITHTEEEISKYVVNILSKEYYVSKNNTFFVFIKDKGCNDWYYYDNAFFSLSNQQEKFEREVTNIYYSAELDFEKLYETGEITIITEEAIDLDVLNGLLKETKAGRDINNQAKYLGSVSEIKFIIEEDLQ